MIIYLQDTRLNGAVVPTTRHRHLKDVKVVRCTENMRLEEVVNHIIAAAAWKKYSIWLLVIAAHGNRGSIQIGAGLNLDNCDFYPFVRLREYMTPLGAGIEIHSCAVASAEPLNKNPLLPSYYRGVAQCKSAHDGLNLVRGISFATKVPVRAQVDAMPLANPRGEFNGVYVEGYPDGRISVCHGVPMPWAT